MNDGSWKAVEKYCREDDRDSLRLDKKERHAGIAMACSRERREALRDLAGSRGERRRSIQA